MPHDKQDSTFTETDLQGLILKSMPLAWQKAYILKGTCATDNFCQMNLYFVQKQSIGDSQTRFKPPFFQPILAVLEPDFHRVIQDAVDLESHHLCHMVITKNHISLVK